jgi:hypothetical protein
MLKYFKICLILTAFIALGFGSKYYKGPGFFWVNNSLGGVFYVTFWCLFFATVFRISGIAFTRLKVSAWVLIITCVLEVLQLVKVSPLTEIRSTYLGAILIGNTFTPTDFIYYVIGAWLGWLLLRNRVFH